MSTPDRHPAPTTLAPGGIPAPDLADLPDLTGSIALVTGANKGIGYEVARLLGGQGATVLVGARDTARGETAEASLRAGGADAHHVSLETTDEASAEKAAAWVDERYGRLDILVNNAGILGSLGAGAPSETPLAAVREVYETNVLGVVAVTNALLPLIRRSARGRIVNVSSEVGSVTSMIDPANPLWPLTSIPYPSSKAALNMVTAMYAKELWDTPVKVNAANPGYCATDFNDNSGFRTPEQGAEAIVALATLGDDGPTGAFYGHVWLSDPGPDDPEYGSLPW
jgi:NAD(P)-dependent dehydrogenase (short-subunit alcohol dehydrogenase family)